MAGKTLEEAWRSRLKTFSRSKQTVSGWCAEQDIPIHQFHYWRRRLADTAPQQQQADSNWMAVVVDPEATSLPPTPTDSKGITIRVGYVAIEVNVGFDPELLRAVVKTLESAPC